eukprot:6172560-Pleurochrysis_carterae.AAC.7
MICRNWLLSFLVLCCVKVIGRCVVGCSSSVGLPCACPRCDQAQCTGAPRMRSNAAHRTFAAGRYA